MKYLTALALIALLSASQGRVEPTRAYPITDPPDGIWAELQTGYGSDSALAGSDGLNFLARTVSPVRLLQAQRNYRDMALVGMVSVTSMITDSSGMTLTVQYAKWTYDAARLHCSRYLDVPVGGGAVPITATVNTTQCVLGEGCVMLGTISSVGGEACP